ncbi:hypothetical protein [Paenibacillus glucanolyticus]|nr:hypothetical protein [Paenibacillus glucanolyticus]
MKKKLAMFGLTAILSISITSIASASFETASCETQQCWMDK